jgi:PPOX class probable F420-dependent enzyme
VAEHYRDILDSKALGHLATIGPDGRPQVNPVWFLSDGQHVYLSVKPDTVKYWNLRTNPAVAMSIGDLAYQSLRRGSGRGRRI